jgi:hypothetical protein
MGLYVKTLQITEVNWWSLLSNFKTINFVNTLRQPKQLVLCWKPDLSSTVIARCEDKLTRNLLKEYCYINMLITPLYF